jgi:hypothetical protein
MEMEFDRSMHLFLAALMTLASVIVLGPGAPSVLAQQAANQALVQLRRKTARIAGH